MVKKNKEEAYEPKHAEQLSLFPDLPQFPEMECEEVEELDPPVIEETPKDDIIADLRNQLAEKEVLVQQQAFQMANLESDLNQVKKALKDQEMYYYTVIGRMAGHVYGDNE